MKKLILMWSLAVVLLMTGGSLASVIDAPHNETNGIKCGTCHSYSLWWQYSPTTKSVNPDHTTIVNAVCMTCHGPQGAQPKAVTHSAVTTNSAYQAGAWAYGCQDCHDPHYQGQLHWVGSVTEPYLGTGTITAVTNDAVNNVTTINYTVATSNANWPAVGALATDLDWADKSASNPGRGLILVQDKTARSNTYSIVSATSSQVVVKGILDPNAIDPTYTNPKTGIKNPLTCNTFGLIYGQLIKYTINAKSVKFFDPNGGFVEAGASTTGICQVCHTLTKHFKQDGVMPSGTDTHVGRETKNCASCHKHDAGFKGGGNHDITSFAWAGNCATCHNPTNATLNIVSDIHLGNCGLCHVNPAGGGIRKAGDPAFGVDATAVGATNASTCVDCHITALTLTGGGIHHDSKTGYAAAGNCVQCHQNAAGKLPANHSLKIQGNAACTSCHTATAGTAAGAPVDPLDPKVHHACTTCHLTSGAPNATTPKAPLRPVGGGDCTACHGSYFSGHSHSHAMNSVPLCINCHVAAAAPFATTGQAHARLACQTCHDAATGVLIGSAVGKTAGANCQTCHSAYFDAHGHTHSMSTVALCVSCHATAITAPYVATGQTHGRLGCLTCHSSTTGALGGSASGKTAGATCQTCHTAYYNGHSHNHSASVKVNSATTPATANCTNCHVATTAPFVAVGQAHATLACQSCHSSVDGSLIGSALGKTTGGECITCHAAYFNGHSHPHTVAMQTTDLAQDAPGTLCASCHLVTTWTNIYAKHLSNCATCHNATRLTGNPTKPAETVGDVIAAKASPTSCLACHWAKQTPAKHGGHNATHFAGSPECTDCHTIGVLGIIEGIHKNICTTCHFDSAGGTGTTIIGSMTNGIDGDARLGVSAAPHSGVTCLTCHPTVTYPTGTIHHDTPNAFNYNCVACHVSGGAHGGDHSLKVIASPNCSATCHPPAAVVGASTGIPVNPADNKVHDACSTCHSTSGAPNATTTKAPLRPLGGGTCNACHGAYFVNHANADHTLKVANNTECQTCHTATAGTATTVPVDGTPGTKVHDACSTCHDATTGAANAITTNSPLRPAGGGDCKACHSTRYFNGHSHGHSMSTVALCVTCHTTATTAPYVASGQTHARLGCQTCHSATTGILIGSAVGQTAGANCQTCHSTYFNGHGHSHSMNTVALCVSCHTTATTAPFVATGQTHARLGCQTCHSATTGALGGSAAGQTAGANCQTCHSTYFNGHGHSHSMSTVALCVSCHTTATTAPFVATGQTHARLGCQTCHSATTGALVGSAAGKTAGATCQTCHAAYFNAHSHGHSMSTVALCVSCHTTATTAPYVATGQTHARLGCQTCHSATTGALVGSATGKMAGATCQTCHSTYFNGHSHGHVMNTVALCLNCHVAAAAPFAATGQAHARLACQTCHSDTTGALTGSAAGKLSGADCSTCHSAYFNGHSHSHSMGTVALCVSCHTTATTAPYVATGQTHARLACQTCHSSTTGKLIGSANGKTAGATCQTCHVIYFDGHSHNHSSSVKVNTATTPATANCTNCHVATTAPFVAAGQAHATLACQSCHSSVNGSLIGSASGKTTGGECITCHTAYFNGHSHPHTVMLQATDLAQAAPGTQCSNCHLVTTWTNIYTKHLGNCATCHNATRLTGNPAKPAETVVDIIAANVNPTSCLACHWAKQTPATHGGHTASQFAGSPECTDCHTIGVLGIVEGIHKNICTTCHATSSGGTGTTILGNTANGVDGDARLGASAAPHSGVTCLTCHPKVTYPTGAIHHDTTNALSYNCVACHVNGGIHGGDHSVRVSVSPNCSTTCHPATAVGTTTGIPVNPADNKVHDACSTCHLTSGAPNATTTKAPSRPIGGGDCNACHGAYFVNHSNANHTAKVVDSTECQSCHTATAGTATTVPVDATPGTKVHDACTTCHDATTGAANATTSKAPLRPAGGGDCKACHGTVYFSGHSHGHNMSAVALCVNCHTTATTAPYVATGQTHARLGCQTCHSATTGVLSGSAAGKTAGANCQTCHSTYFNGHGHTHSMSTVALCVSCHTTATTAPFVATGQTHARLGCQTCHSATTGALSGSAAGKLAGANCQTCHATYFNGHSHNHNTTVKVNTATTPNRSNCIGCHSATTAPFVATGQVHAPLGCQECHNTTNGALIGSALGKTTGGECITCHSTYFNGHLQHNSTTHAVLMRATDLSNSAACNTCHRRAGTTSANPLFTNAWGGTDGIYALHQLGCTECHDSTRTTNIGAGYTSVNNVIMTAVAPACLDCHADRAAGHGGHNVTDFVKDATCTTACHTGANIVLDIHKNKCGDCHVNPLGGGTRRAGTDGSGLLGDASGLHRLATCLTCHPVATYPTGGIHHDTVTAANNGCTTCHTAVNHTTMIATTTACTSCHTGTAGLASGAPVSLTDSMIHDSCRTCHTFNAQKRGILVNFTNAKGVNGTGTLPDGGTIGGTNGGGACTVCHTVATPSTYHHTSNYRVVGQCEYCHADPRPSWNTTRPGDNVGGVLTGSGTQIPTNLACADCHVRWTGSAGNYTMTINKFTRTVYTSYATAWTTTAQHTFTGMSSNKINSFGICFKCHDGTTATKVSVWHGRPDRFGGATWALGTTRWQRCQTNGDEAHYAPGRASSGIGRFNFYRANYYYPNANTIQPGSNDCSAYYTTYQNAGTGLPANLRITIPSVVGHNDGMTGTLNPAVFAKTTQGTGTSSAAADNVQVTAATWNGATTNLVVNATTTNAGGCPTLSVTTQPDNTARGAMSGTGTCTLTVAVATMPATVDVKTSNTSGVNALGYRVTALDATAPTDGVLTVSPGNTQNGLAWTAASDAGGLRATNTYDVRFLTGATAPTCSTGTSVYLGTALTYTHAALTNGTQYSYRVCAYDAANNVSTGATASGTPSGLPAVGALTATPSTAAYVPAAFTLTSSVTSTVALTGCEYTTNGSTWTAGTVSGAASPYTCTAILTGQTGALTLNMRATSSNGTGAGTAIARTVDAAGPSDGALTVTSGNVQNSLTWTAALDAASGLAAANTYDVRFLTGAAAPTCSTGTSVYTGTALTFTHTALTNGTQYSYRVCAVDNVGNVSTGVTGSVTPSATVPVIGAITATPSTATYVSAAFALSTSVTATVAPVGCEYTTNGSTWSAATVSGATSPYTCSVNLSGQAGTLTLNLRATTTGGTGTGTAIVRTVDAGGPTDGTLALATGNAQNALTWTAASDAASGLAATNTYDVRFLTGATAPTCTTGTSVYTGAALTFTHTALTNGTQYSYRVCAYDAVNNASTGATGSGTPSAATPPTMGAITATPSTTTYVPAAFALTSSVTSTVSLTNCEYTTNGSIWTAGTVSGASSPYTCTANLTGQAGSLTLNMRATNTGGTGTGTAITKTVDASGPTDGTVAVTPGNAQNGLTWTAASDGASGMAAVNTYDVRFQTGATAPTCTTGTSIYTGTALTYTHAALTNGTQYSYRVCAYDSVNNVSTGATGSGTPSAGGAVVNYYVTPQASGWGVGADGAITWASLGDIISNNTANTNRAGTQTTATTGTVGYAAVPSASSSATNQEFFRMYTPAYTSATTLAANIPYVMDTIMDAAGDSASFTLALYDYNPAGASGNGVQIGSTKTITMASQTTTVQHWTGNFGNASSYAIAAGHRLELRILGTYQSCAPGVLIGNAPNTSGSTSAHGAVFISPTESGGSTAVPTMGTITATPSTSTYVPAAFALTSSVTSTVALTGCEYTINGSSWSTGTVSGASSPYTCTGNLTGQTGSLTLNMRATNSGGTGTGTAITRTVDATAPTTGTLTVTPGVGQNGLSWTASTDAASGLRTTNTYDVRFLTGATAPTCTTGTSAYTGTALTYTHTGLTGGTQYSYRVCAYDNVNNVSTGATGSGTPTAGGGTVVNYYVTTQASTWGVGADGNITWTTLGDIFSGSANNNRVGTQTTATTGTAGYLAVPSAVGSGTNQEFFRMYTPAYAAAKTLSANIPYTIDTIMDTTGTSASFTLALYDYNPAGTSGNGTQIGSTKTITMSPSSTTVQHWTGNFGNTSSYAIASGHRLELRILGTYQSCAPGVLIGNAPNTNGSTSQYGAVFVSPTEQ